jgi:hypothetical protein
MTQLIHWKGRRGLRFKIKNNKFKEVYREHERFYEGLLNVNVIFI